MVSYTDKPQYLSGLAWCYMYVISALRRKRWGFLSSKITILRKLYELEKNQSNILIF
jgi:hypothetical protein